MIERIEAELGPLYAVCSNAGLARWSPIERVSESDFDELVAVNLTGAFNVGQAAARTMVERGMPGRIIFTSSVHVKMPFEHMAVYGGTKQALRAMAETMAVELAAARITVNHLAPGWVRTFLNDASPSLRTIAGLETTLATVPLGRAGEPIEMGRAVSFLCSEAAAYVTGAYIAVDGGLGVAKY